jgi:hypothetical protein
MIIGHNICYVQVTNFYVGDNVTLLETSRNARGFIMNTCYIVYDLIITLLLNAESAVDCCLKINCYILSYETSCLI